VIPRDLIGFATTLGPNDPALAVDFLGRSFKHDDEK
jgi:hypothetical protein